MLQLRAFCLLGRQFAPHKIILSKLHIIPTKKVTFVCLTKVTFFNDIRSLRNG